MIKTIMTLLFALPAVLLIGSTQAAALSFLLPPSRTEAPLPANMHVPPQEGTMFPFR